MIKPKKLNINKNILLNFYLFNNNFIYIKLYILYFYK